MAASAELKAILRPAVEASFPAAHYARNRKVDRVITDDAHVDASRIVGEAPSDIFPALDLTQIDPTDGAPYDTAHDQIAAVANAYTPGGTDVAVADGGTAASTASGARTNLGLAIGTDIPPLASPDFTGTLTAANLTATGDSTLGNADADTTIVQGHLRHKSAAPSASVGAALGTGGSPGVGVVVTGTDQRMTVALTAGSASLTAGVAGTITFATARPTNDYKIAICPVGVNAGANAVQFRISTKSTGSFTIAFAVAPTANLTYTWDIFVDEQTN